MNTMILTGGNTFGGGEGGNIGIGFAVPSNLAKTVMDQIMKNGKVSRGYFSVSVQELTPDLASQFGLKNAHGAIFSETVHGGPGDKAGLKSGDVITAIDGKEVQNSDDLTMDVISHSPGSTVSFKCCSRWQADGGKGHVNSTARGRGIVQRKRRWRRQSTG